MKENNESIRKYQNIQLYKVTVKIHLVWIKINALLPKPLQITYGDLITRELIHILRLVIQASLYPEERRKALKQILIYCGEIETFSSIVFNNSKPAQEHIAEFVDLLDQIGKQSHGWLNKTI